MQDSIESTQALCSMIKKGIELLEKAANEGFLYTDGVQRSSLEKVIDVSALREAANG